MQIFNLNSLGNIKNRDNKKGDDRMNFELTASMMCANYGNLEREVTELEAGGIDSFHIDIMDGRYVCS